MAKLMTIMTGSEIASILKTLNPVSLVGGFVACPLNLVAGCHGNPGAQARNASALAGGVLAGR